MKHVELLSPAGTLKNMRYAFAYGADAVYAGQPRYSLRVRNNDFLEDNLATGIAEAHQLGKKFFLATNVIPHNSKVKTFIKDLTPIIAMQPDALIMADPGLIMMVRETWPDMPVHLSVQANTVNYASVKFWKSIGIERVILSRELSLYEIAEIRQECPDMELEVFVHGALCIAYSGRCLLSGYFNHRDPNQGTCTNSCRWKYDTLPAHENAEGDYVPDGGALSMADISTASCGGAERHPLADNIYFLEEEGRKGELLPIMEDENGTYIMNSKDLRAIEHIQRLVEIGVDSLKIEGRTKSHYYVARTAQTYRQAIDDALADRPFNPQLLGVLENLASRGYTDGFYQRHHTHEHQNYINGYSKSHQQQFCGEIRNFDPNSGLAEIDVKNKFSVGDRLELILPEGNRDIVIEKMEDLHGRPMQEASGGGYEVRIPLPGIKSDKGLLARYI
ncbi:tRNA 5-hydroxyuridine modification protein YegQ [Methylicorpusculum sp.]|uniref:prephenate-dependent tRNA uridine(34) hydroxylase TrhP n=1 Tax=Methylicorpusculum sp. TaxID=2713644 RepID=UPI0027300B68|nr:tRNA 5-hydroxyuridine modification protein YegQ [Methylicorpusculum sp.]MDP2178516.1 tRNA 5-hydroxyuridine modification protein YegQ [Methylicorpusculum sp.]MDP3530125.1 tRNA 5-hydroxyuridine modification protein YegQ [Methylicorpusculum sp.]MDZ4150955.1 tRNA 5-hydroxyuridine modification protein YegQ [Methylicorpusculum sp.]